MDNEKHVSHKDFVITGNAVFGYLSDEPDVVIPDGVDEIGLHAFSCFDNITSVYIPPSVKLISIGAFQDCTALRSVTLSEGIEHIGSYAFSGCTGLQEINFPNSLTELGNFVFCDCFSLRPTGLSNNVKTFGRNAFKGCKLWADNDGFIIVNNILYDYIGSEASIVIPDGVTEIAEEAFIGRTDIRSITIPESLKEIAGYAFESCTNLLSINLPEGLTSIGAAAFHGCTSLRKIVLPSTITTISTSVFFLCDNLTDIVLPNGIEAFGDSVLDKLWTTFSGSNLTPNYAASLLRQYLPLIQKSRSLKTRITSVASDIVSFAAGQNDSSCLEPLFSLYKRIPPDKLDKWLGLCENSISVRAALLEYKSRHYSPQALEELEKIKTEKELGLRERTVSDWKSIFGIRPVGSSIIITKYKDNSPDVVIPYKIGRKAVVEIGRYAFVNNSIVTSVALPEGIERINERAFASCAKLRSITLPDSLRAIGEYAISDCPALESIVIPEGVEKISAHAFEWCRNLESITLPRSVRDIYFDFSGDEMVSPFGYCDKLVLRVPSGSYAEQYAIEHNFDYISE